MSLPTDVASGTRYVGLAVIPKRRRAIEHALGRIAELGGDALLITADGSANARYPGVRHIDLLHDEMTHGVNRLIAVSPKRVAGKFVGKQVGGRSLAWRGWVKSRPYKVYRFSLLRKLLDAHAAEIEPDTVTHLLIAGVESWPIAWQISRTNPDVVVGWDVPDEWKRPVEEEPLGLRRIAVWGGHATWYMFSQGGPHSAEFVHTFAASSWITQAGEGADAADLIPVPEAAEAPADAGVDDDVFDEALVVEESMDERAVRQDLSASLVADLVEVEPEVVVLDAIGEFTDLLAVGQWCTASEFTESAGVEDELRARATRVLAWNAPERVDLFREAARTVAERLMAGLPDARFILHRVWLSEREEEPAPKRGARTAPGLPVGQVNDRLRSYYESLELAFAGRLEVLEMPEALRVMGARHQRGVTHRGFTRGYYEAAVATLDATLRTPPR